MYIYIYIYVCIYIYIYTHTIGEQSLNHRQPEPENISRAHSKTCFFSFRYRATFIELLGGFRTCCWSGNCSIG